MFFKHLPVLFALIAFTQSCGDHSVYPDPQEEATEHRLAQLGFLSSVESMYALKTDDQESLQKLGFDAYGYEPSIFTIASGLSSRIPKREQKDWKRKPLGLLAENIQHKFYNKAVNGYFNENLASESLVIMMGSSYSSWKRGSWHNKMAQYIHQSFDQTPNMLAFSGFLTDEWLGFAPITLDLSGERSMRDVYHRIRLFIGHENYRRQEAGKKLIRNVGLMGFSGGARLVFHLLQADAGQESQIMNLGGIAYNPIVHLDTALDNLDTVHNDLVSEGFSKFGSVTAINYRGLTSSSWSNKKLKARILYDIYLNDENAAAQSVINLTKEKYKEDRDDLVRHFLNDFVASDAARISEHLGLKTIDHDALYRKYAFQKHAQKGWVKKGVRFTEYTSIRGAVDAIKAPLYVIFPKDDPVLSNPFYRTDSFMLNHDQSRKQGVPEVVSRDLEYMSKKPNIRIFTPERGGHLGYFADEVWMRKTLKAFWHNL